MNKKRLMKMAKKLLPQELINKVKSIKDETEAEKALQYLLVSHLERTHYALENKISNLKINQRNFQNILAANFANGYRCHLGSVIN